MRSITRLLYKVPAIIRWPLTVVLAFVGVQQLFTVNSYKADLNHTNTLHVVIGLACCLVALLFLIAAGIESNEQTERRRR